MPSQEDKPIGAPVLAERRRDRISIWIAKHGRVVPLIRLAAGLAVFAVVVLVFDHDWAWTKVLAIVAGAVAGGKLAEHEKERGERLESTELTEDSISPRAPESDSRYLRRRYL